MLFPILFLLGLGLAVLAQQLASIVLLAYALLSGLTFLIYAIDKSAARRQRRRVPENTLHLLALLGGWPGAWLAQRTLRHKSSKRSFRWRFWLTVLVNCGTLIAYAGLAAGL